MFPRLAPTSVRTSTTLARTRARVWEVGELARRARTGARRDAAPAHRRGLHLARLAVMSGYVAVAAVLGAGVLLVTAAMLARRLLAPRAPLPAKLTTYESGVDPVGVDWAQTKVRYFVFS